ncbi:MAG: YceI family protein [Ilumatobacteraceae bacterium]
MSTVLTPESERPPEAPRPWYRRRWFLITAIVVVLLAAAAGGGIWWFLKDDAPAAVNLDSATQSLSLTTVAQTATTADSATTTAATADATTTAAASVAVAGTWTVDTSVGEFGFESSTGTFVGFRVQEELSTIGSTTAVGRTPTVSGEITFDATTLTAATIQADMTAISTNESRRDDRVQDALETGEFPTATFVLTAPIDLGGAVNSGAATTVDAAGDLTIHGVTTPVTLPLEAQLVNGTIVVVGSLDIALSTYGVEAPSAPIVVSVSDDAQIELQLFFVQA